MRRRARRLACAAALLFFTGCAPTLTLSLGEMPAADPQAKIQAGMTTRQEIVGLFGQPDLAGVSEDGLPTWTYTRAVVEVAKAKDAVLTGYFNLKVTFKGDLVDSYSLDRKAQ